MRRGAAFVAVRADGCVLLRSRPPKGLLGGMTEVPTTDWSHDFDDKNALDSAPRLSRATPKWRRLPGVVTHVFTHFPLELIVYAAKVPRNTARAGRRALGRRSPSCTDEALPTVMRKVLAHALEEFSSAPSRLASGNTPATSATPWLAGTPPSPGRGPAVYFSPTGDFRNSAP